MMEGILENPHNIMWVSKNFHAFSFIKVEGLVDVSYLGSIFQPHINVQPVPVAVIKKG